jgi:hypothetical protein
MIQIFGEQVMSLFIVGGNKDMQKKPNKYVYLELVQ